MKIGIFFCISLFALIFQHTMAMFDYRRPKDIMRYDYKTQTIKKQHSILNMRLFQNQQFTTPRFSTRSFTHTVVQTLHDIKNEEEIEVAVPQKPSDILKAACIGSVLGSIAGYYFNRSFFTATITAFIFGIGRSLYKNRYPDTEKIIDCEDILSGLKRELRQKDDYCQDFPLADLHTPDNGFVLVGKNETIEVNNASPYEIVMHVNTLRSMDNNRYKIQALLQIRKLFDDHHQQQVSQANSAPSDWQKYTLQKDGQYALEHS